MAQPPKPPRDLPSRPPTPFPGDAEDPSGDQLSDLTRPSFELPESMRMEEHTPPARAASAPVADDAWDFPEALAEGTVPPPAELEHQLFAPRVESELGDEDLAIALGESDHGNDPEVEVDMGGEGDALGDLDRAVDSVLSSTPDVRASTSAHAGAPDTTRMDAGDIDRLASAVELAETADTFDNGSVGDQTGEMAAAPEAPDQPDSTDPTGGGEHELEQATEQEPDLRPQVVAAPPRARMIDANTQQGIAPAPAPLPGRVTAPVAATTKKPSRSTSAAAPPAATSAPTATPSGMPARGGAAAEADPDRARPANTVPRDAVHARAATGGDRNVADHGWFRQESQRLARARDWQKLAALSAAAIESAPWAELPETRSALLLELARLYRDRLVDPMGAEETFRRLAQTDPAHAEACDFLAERYRMRSEWRALYDLYNAGVEATWDPPRRQEWTRQAVAIAHDKLGSDTLVIASWERLWQLGEGEEEAARNLIEIYRRALRWDQLADFLKRRAGQKTGAERIAGLREVAEIYVSGLRDPERADEVLGVILTELPDDPIALMARARVMFRRGDVDGLATLAVRPLEGVNPAAALDLLRLVGDALWSAGNLDAAMRAWDRILALVPDDVDGLRSKEEALVKTGRVGELIDFLIVRAERAASDDVRCELVTRAARLAERELGDRKRAIALWERVLAVKPKQLDAVRALVELHELEEDPVGVARSLELELSLTRDPEVRLDLLRKIGDHAANRAGDTARAESAWQELLVAVPDDGATWDALIALYRHRGDFEGIDRALSSRAFRPTAEETLTTLWRHAAQNVEAMPAPDPARAVRAWLRVIDLSPDDGTALGAVVHHHAGLERPHELIAGIEAQLMLPDADGRLGRVLDLAARWEAEGDRAAAQAAFERALRWRADDSRALEGLGRVAGDAAWLVATALEAASAAAERGSELRTELLRIRLEALASADALSRFFELRRILWLSPDPIALLDEVADAAERASAHADLVALLADLATSTEDETVRAGLLRRQAALLEDKLREPVRALLALDAIARRPVTDAAVVDAIARLCEATGRHEDLLAVLDVQARGGDREARRAALRRRAAILGRLGDAVRAFHEQARLLALDPGDAQALADARRHAEAGQLWRQLDALYGELFDRAGTQAERVELARLRATLRKGPIQDARGALEQLVVAYRLEPDAEGVEDELRAAAQAEGVWPRVLPIIEARARALGGIESVDALLRIAADWEQVGAQARAFELTCAAAPLRPEDAALRETLERRAKATERQDVLALVLRRTAARAGDRAGRLEIYGRVAGLYAELDRPGEALDVHRRLLQIDDRALPSLEAVIAHQRKAGLGRQLQQSLRAWLEAAPQDAPGRIDRLLEIAEVSRDQLGDVGAALDVYAEILTIKPDAEEALAGLRAASSRVSDPALELKLLRMELDQAQGARRVELLLAYAGIEHKRLGNLGGAIATLKSVISETGPTGRGYEPLAEVLRAQRAWAPLVDLMEQRALAIHDAHDRAATLRKALALCEEHADDVGSERFERVAGRLMVDRPDDREVRRKLAAHFRRADRHEELARVLAEALAALPAGPASEADRIELEAELAQLYDRALGRREDAEQVLATRLARNAGDAEALLHQASIRRRAGDFEGYLAARREHAKGLPKPVAAIALCHLAEACDDTPGQQPKVAAFYRDARGLDGQNALITEALKAIGRRAKGWRAHAALLPDPEEARLSWAERATRLLARAEGAAVADPSGAIAWVERAVMVDPDSVAAWDALATRLAERGDDQLAIDAQRSALAAFERGAPATDREAHRREHAERLQALADWVDSMSERPGAPAESDGSLIEEGLRCSERAHELAPAFPPACLATAARLRASGDLAGAHALYDRALTAQAEPLSDDQRLEATFRRGALAAALGKNEDAIADLRAALRLNPLHPGALSASADVLIATGRVGSAAQHVVQALLVAHEPTQRGPLYARLAKLWEEMLGRPDEAAVCYELAIAAGVEDRDVMARGLRLSRQYGRGERALAVIEQLLPRTTDGRELAQLWAEKGELLSQGREPQAIEAYDMALSYDQSNARALSGLLRLLERRGEWEQVIELLSARLDGGTSGEKSEAKRSLTRVARELDRSKDAKHHELAKTVKGILNPAS